METVTRICIAAFLAASCCHIIAFSKPTDMPTTLTSVENTDMPTTLTSAENTDMPTAGVDDIHGKIVQLREAMDWLKFYEYATEEDFYGVESCYDCEIEECDSNCLFNLTSSASGPISRMKSFYRIEPEDGNLTESVLNIMKERRCRERDIKEAYKDYDLSKAHLRRVKRYTRLANTKWDLRRTPILTISFRDYHPKLTRQQQEQIAAECATMWAQPSGLQFQIKPFSSATNIGINYQYIDGPYNSLGSGQSPTAYSNGYSFLRLDKSEPWKIRNSAPGQGVSLKWAMCHEMGHNLDFGHSNDRNSIMYPSANYGPERLTNDDTRGVINLYGGANGKTVVSQPRQAPRPALRPAPRPAPRPRPPIRPTARPTPKPRSTAKPVPKLSPRQIQQKKKKLIEKRERQRNKAKRQQKRKERSRFRGRGKTRRGTVADPRNTGNIFQSRGTAPPFHTPRLRPGRR